MAGHKILKRALRTPVDDAVPWDDKWLSNQTDRDLDSSIGLLKGPTVKSTTYFKSIVFFYLILEISYWVGKKTFGRSGTLVYVERFFIPRFKLDSKKSLILRRNSNVRNRKNKVKKNRIELKSKLRFPRLELSPFFGAQNSAFVVFFVSPWLTIFWNVTGEQKICGRAREEQMSMTVERKLARQKKDVKTQGGGVG